MATPLVRDKAKRNYYGKIRVKKIGPRELPVRLREPKSYKRIECILTLEEALQLSVALANASLDSETSDGTDITLSVKLHDENEEGFYATVTRSSKYPIAEDFRPS